MQTSLTRITDNNVLEVFKDIEIVNNISQAVKVPAIWGVINNEIIKLPCIFLRKIAMAGNFIEYEVNVLTKYEEDANIIIEQINKKFLILRNLSISHFDVVDTPEFYHWRAAVKFIGDLGSEIIIWRE